MILEVLQIAHSGVLQVAEPSTAAYLLYSLLVLTLGFLLFYLIYSIHQRTARIEKAVEEIRKELEEQAKRT